MRVVCTAGHVDHGKSALVKALTGMEPDRFDEERRRGLTIDLGFAWTELDDHTTVAFVDLPGHERFIGNMLAGSGAVELALFVVAADEGWMPQSQEHLEILDLLGISHGLVTITKADLVDAETLDLAVELVRDALAGTTFAQVDVLTVSAASGAGLDALRRGLVEALARAPSPADRSRPRLWVDRSFSVTGAGTVVTGTLSGGHLRTGDQLTLMPSTRHVRIRGLQSLQSAVAEAAPGSRVAVNLAGVDRREAARGDALVSPGQWLATATLEAWVRALHRHTIESKGAWHLHAGSAHRLARIRPLTSKTVGSAGGFVRIELDRPLALNAGDRVVLREAGRRATMGGGIVLDPDPPRPQRGQSARDARALQLAVRRRLLDTGDGAGLLAQHIQERGAADAGKSAAAVGLDAASADAAAIDHGLVRLAGAFAHPESMELWARDALQAMRGYHRKHPVERVAPKDIALRAVARAGCPRQLGGAVLDALVAKGTIAAEGPGLRAPEHAVELDAAQRQARDALLAALAAEPFSPPGLDAAMRQTGASEALVRELEASGAVVKLGSDLALTTEALEAAHDRLATAYASEGPLSAARAKEILGTSRKYALPLLEELDRRGLTRRRGDVRDVL